MRRRVTFSRNITLSLSRTCQCFCKYCSFKTHRAHLHAPDEVLALLDGAARRNVKELLVLTGERPEVNPEVRERLHDWGHADFTAYVAWACERALERGLLPHTNLGVLSRGGSRPAARGHRVAGPDARVDASPTSSPTRARRRRTPRAACRPSAGPASCASRSRAGSWSASASAPRTASRRCRRSPPCTPSTGTCRRSSSRTSCPHRRYHGEEPGEIATEAAEEFWRTGLTGDGRACRRPRGPRRCRSTTCARSSARHASCCRASASRSRPTWPTGGPSSSPPARPTSAA